VISLAYFEGLADSEIAVALGETEARVVEIHESALARLGGVPEGVRLIRDQVIHPVYLPFSETQLRRHFAPVAGKDPTFVSERHLAYYRASAERNLAFRRLHPREAAPSIRDAKGPCQVEKDERFWVVACLLRYYYAPDRDERFASILSRAFGQSPPMAGFSRWQECFGGEEVYLFFEANLPSPPAYRKWLAKCLPERHLVPYVLDAGLQAAESLEGPTHVDALLLDASSGCAVLFEAKVLSDCSCQVTFDARRNQVARNIDVMLDPNSGLPEPLSHRDPERTLFALLTPRMFRDDPRSRMYGTLMAEYQANPLTLATDLPHREAEWESVSRRVGWLSWEDCEEVLPGACPWLI
jgi:hypothetical protein